MNEVFGALADPTRRAILARALGEGAVTSWPEPFAMAQSGGLQTSESDGASRDSAGERDAQRRPAGAGLSR